MCVVHCCSVGIYQQMKGQRLIVLNTWGLGLARTLKKAWMALNIKLAEHCF